MRALGLLVLLTGLPASGGEDQAALRLLKTQVRLADRAQGAAILGKRDGFVAALSPFDRSARLATDREVGEPEYLRFVAQQALPIGDSDRERLADAVRALDQKLTRLGLSPAILPAEITIVKTTGMEESHAAYTRQRAILLPANNVEEGALEPLLAHELFHLLSRNHPALRKQLYALVGFRPCNEVLLPASLRARKITNPDEYQSNYQISVAIDGIKRDVVPVLYSSSEHYDPHRGFGLLSELGFFPYIVFRLLDVHSGEQLDPKQVPDFRRQLGGGSDQPDEVLAHDFAALVEGEASAPAELLSAIRRVLSSAR